MHDCLTILELLELGNIIGDSVHGLLTYVTEPTALLNHIDNVVLEAFLLNVPHELHILATGHKDITVITSY